MEARALGLPSPHTPQNNFTVWALDLATGKPKWSYFIDGVGFRGGLMVSGGVVYVPSGLGTLYMLDADTGKLLATKQFGTPLWVQPSMGATADGDMRLAVVFGGQFGLWSPQIPGAVMVYGLPDKLPEPQVITKEVIKEVVKEVVKEVPKEVTKTVTVETISPISYAAIGVSIVVLVIAGVLFTRRKKA